MVLRSILKLKMLLLGQFNAELFNLISSCLSGLIYNNRLMVKKPLFLKRTRSSQVNYSPLMSIVQQTLNGKNKQSSLEMLAQ
jgi:hypothetical protein